MRKYRILEKLDFNGDVCFIPQEKHLWLWLSFYNFEFFPKLIKFYSLSFAKDFIIKQKTAPKPKIHNV